MGKGPIQSVLEHIRGLVVAQEAAGLADNLLLERFLTQQDEAAFEALVRRHGPMVMGVCRRMLRNPDDAEDAFQATFLVLGAQGRLDCQARAARELALRGGLPHGSGGTIRGGPAPGEGGKGRGATTTAGGKRLAGTSAASGPGAEPSTRQVSHPGRPLRAGGKEPARRCPAAWSTGGDAIQPAWHGRVPCWLAGLRNEVVTLAGRGLGRRTEPTCHFRSRLALPDRFYRQGRHLGAGGPVGRGRRRFRPCRRPQRRSRENHVPLETQNRHRRHCCWEVFSPLGPVKLPGSVWAARGGQLPQGPAEKDSQARGTGRRESGDRQALPQVIGGTRMLYSSKPWKRPKLSPTPSRDYGRSSGSPWSRGK